MKRFALLLAALGMIAITANSDAAPRGGGGGRGIGNGNGGYRGGYNNGYGGYNNGYRGYGYGGYGIGIGGLGIGIGGYGGNYYGGGYGNGYGSGYGNGYGSGYNGGYGYNSYNFPSNWYSAAPMTGRLTSIDSAQGIAPAAYADPAPTAHWGLRIEEVTTGGAAQKADLRKGDVIIGVGKTRTETFEELQQALAASRGTIEVTFLNSESQKMEKLRVTPNDGKIGVSVVSVDLQ